MPAELLKGKPLADKIKEKLNAELAKLKARPVLASVQVGSNPAAGVYIRAQQKAAEKLGIDYKLHTLDTNIQEVALIKFIEGLNQDKNGNGIIVQLPLPKGVDHKKVINAILPLKDAEGMHPQNLGKLLLGSFKVAPCTALAVMELIEFTGVKLYGKEVVVVGHSEIVGKHLSLLLLNKFATTTVCHIATGERGVLPEHAKRAEILVVAVGKANLIKGDWIKPGAIVIDVGINRVDDKIVGDVEFDKASQRASFITPVPGGVGPLTVTMLLRNVIELCKLQNQT
jgi:methylenetetrahydrofolate dehydrogenase (NADP+)/methenyltetrahydrofolate cyclohydrolase